MKKLPYEDAEIRVISLECSDIVTASPTTMGDGKDIDSGGWTDGSW